MELWKLIRTSGCYDLRESRVATCSSNLEQYTDEGTKIERDFAVCISNVSIYFTLLAMCGQKALPGTWFMSAWVKLEDANISDSSRVIR